MRVDIGINVGTSAVKGVFSGPTLSVAARALSFKGELAPALSACLEDGAGRLGFSNLNTFSNRQAPYGRGNAELDEIVGRALAAVTEADQAALSREGHLYAMEHQFSISLPWINSAWASRKDAIAEWQPVAASASPNSFETMRGPETA